MVKRKKDKMTKMYQSSNNEPVNQCTDNIMAKRKKR